MLLTGRERDDDQAALPLLLLPGTLCDEGVFGPLRERLAGIRTRVVLTLEAGSLAEAAQTVLAHAPERFALLGFSLGGLVAMETALCAPRRVRGLALISTNPLPVPLEQHGPRRLAAEEARQTGVQRFVRERLWPQYCGRTPCPDMLPLLEQMAGSLGAATFGQQTEMALGRGDYRSRLPAVTCPTLIVAGTEDKVCSPVTQEELAGSLQDCTRVMLPGAGHFPLLERPDEVAAAVAAWFHNVEANGPRAA